MVGIRHDRAARDIVDEWAAHDAALLSCEDFSTAGWRHRLGDRRASRAVVSGAVVPESDIHGVLVRRQWILDLELAHIEESDREYVAAEMNAFLVSWLTNLACPVLIGQAPPLCAGRTGGRCNGFMLLPARRFKWTGSA